MRAKGVSKRELPLAREYAPTDRPAGQAGATGPHWRRENDIYEFFCETQALGTHFLARTCVDCLANYGGHTIDDEMSETAVQGMHRVVLGNDDHADIELRDRRIQIFRRSESKGATLPST